MPVTIDRGAPIDVAVKLRDIRYFVPRRTQGPAHRDGELVMQKGELISLERVAAPGSAGGAAADFAAPRAFSVKLLAKMVPGRTTRKQIEALLGEPSRTIDADEDEATPESWEWRGKDASGTYWVHVEFDNHSVVSLIVKVPDKTTLRRRPWKKRRPPPASPEHRPPELRARGKNGGMRRAKMWDGKSRPLPRQLGGGWEMSPFGRDAPHLACFPYRTG